MKRAMRSLTARLLLLPALLCLSAAPAGAITADAGTTSLQFLKVEVGARPAALGGAYAALSEEASACFWNPAGLAAAQPGELFFTYNRFIADISQSAASYTFDVRGLRLGTSINYFGMGELERRRANTLDPEGVFSPFDLALGLSAAYQINEQLAAGVTTRFVHEDIDSYNASALLFDIGVRARTMIPGLVGAVLVRNLGTDLKYERLGYNVPWELSFGASYGTGLPWSEELRLLVSAELITPNDDRNRAALGAELGFREFLFGRIGYRSNVVNRDLSWGLGLAWMKLRFDYAYVPYELLGSSHRFSFIYAF